MRKILSILMALAVTVCCTFTFHPVTAQAKVINIDVTEASEGCILLGMPGTYYAQIDKAVKRINAIRKEACEEGVINPSTGKKLKESDYVPIKWSSDLEYIARIRAAEASLTMNHVRTDGSSCFRITSENGVSSYGEVLAWNYSTGMIQGINQWYAEKKYWVKQDSSQVTGHYTQMIDPSNTYVGLGTFYSKNAAYPNTTAGEFTSASGLDTTRGTTVKNCIQVLNVSKENLSGSFKVNANAKMAIGTAQKASVRTAVAFSNYWGNSLKTNNLIVMYPEWSSSDPDVAEISSTGSYTASLTAKSIGKTTLTASAGGKTVKKTITVTGPETSLVSLKRSGKTLKVNFKKQTENTDGYEIQYSVKSGFSSAKTKKITGAAHTSTVIKGVNASKIYYVRIRTFKTVDGVTYYSAWSKKLKK